MTSISNKEVASSIIEFLKKSVAEKEIAEDYSESIDVAIDCVADAFEVDKSKSEETVKDKFGGKSLLELLTSVSSNVKEVKSTSVGEDTKKKADELKVVGNRAMAAKDFGEAIQKYTEAIELDPTNAVYFSNRAAAYSSNSQHEKAIEDAAKAIEINPSFSKAYSRLGLAKYAVGDAKGSMEAYKKGLDIEGDAKSPAMARGYETAKKRVEENLEKSIDSTDRSPSVEDDGSASAGGSGGSGSNGMPDLASMFGGNGGGMPSFSEMMNNPQIMQAAQEMMSNPSALQNLMSNPSVRQMAESLGVGGGEGGEGSTPDLSNIMNNPMLQNMAKQFMGGNNGNSN